ncbi:hypothetical protein cym2001_41120 [Pseudomonas sp. CYM-20-01]|uniref:hypothetical protein n=1 Tax=Pseudomonas sp. CYM-20-01 TaxID=2870750 RepID=UPI002067B823|nr:hypothetical protein [Pseudomonas sp. CYM-20-01]BDB20747.1 hypothetical protein cym2001_41120 [Pseudomonas sp. CYM-20-01]
MGTGSYGSIEDLRNRPATLATEYIQPLPGQRPSNRVNKENAHERIHIIHAPRYQRPGCKRWARYITRLRGTGLFDGGSAICEGECLRKGHTSVAAVADISGFVRVRAKNLEDAKALFVGNPVFEAGGTVEILELPRQ